MRRVFEIPVVSHEGVLGFKTGDTIFTCLHPNDLADCFKPGEESYGLKIYSKGQLVDEASGIGDPSGGRGAADCFFGLKGYPMATAHLQAGKLQEGDVIVVESDNEPRMKLEQVVLIYYLTNETVRRFDLARKQGNERPWEEVGAAVEGEPHPTLLRHCFMG